MKSAARENYLKTIFELQESDEGGIVSLSAIAREMNLSAGTVTGMVKKLADADLLDYRAYAGCRLTAKGRETAVRVLRKHRLIELFLVKTIGLDWADVHAEAERLEHAVSTKVLDGIDRLLEYPRFDPHGDPIPDKDGSINGHPRTRLSELSGGDSGEVTRVLDESPDFLRFIGSMGLYPGTRFLVEEKHSEAGTITVRPDGCAAVTIGLLPAGKLLAAIV